MRALVKETMSREHVDTLARDIEEACATLARKGGAHESERQKIVTGPGHDGGWPSRPERWDHGRMRAASLSTRIGAWMYRRFDGRAMGGTAGAPVVMLTRARAAHRPAAFRVRAGDPRRRDLPRVGHRSRGTPPTPTGSATCGAPAGRRCRTGRRCSRWMPSELTGAERDTAWRDVVLAALPGVEKYATKVRSHDPGRPLDPDRVTRAAWSSAARSLPIDPARRRFRHAGDNHRGGSPRLGG